MYLSKFIDELKPKKIVEIGTFFGKSAIFMAKKLNPNTQKLFCIDPWVPYHGITSIEGKQGILIAYEQFISNCIHHKVYDRIIPMRMSSMEAVSLFSN